MGDLAKYIAEVVEFVVAGVLVFFSLLLLGYVVVRPDLDELPAEVPFLTSLGALLPVVAVALIYALGILAEGMSRIIFEHGLEELTAKELDGRGSEDQKKTLQVRLAGIRVSAEKDPIRYADAEHAVKVEHYVALREEWRMRVMAGSAPLHAQVEGQLKRLRIERAAALSGGISSLALLVDIAVLAWQDGMEFRGVLLAALVIVTAAAARLWLVRKQVPDVVTLPAEVKQPRRVPRRVVQAAALSGSLFSLVLLVHLVVEVDTDEMSLRAALLLATLTVSACAVALSLVRLKRYLGSIVRCHDALPGALPTNGEPAPARTVAS